MIMKANQFFYRYLKNLILSAMIKHIKDKYDFKDGFDFYSWLRDLKNWSELYKERENLTVIREMKTQFTNLITTSATLTDLLTSLLMRRDEFSKYLDPFQDELLRYSPKLGWAPEELQDILMDFKVSWQNSLESLPTIKKGRPLETNNTRCVNLLVMMFMDGSELEPICYRNDHQEGQYYGYFYDFMMDMQPILQALGITLDIQNESLGRYAVELISKRRADYPSCYKISQIDEFLLQE